MLTIVQLPTGDLAVKCHYLYRDRIRKVPGARFDGNMKQWIVPAFDLGYLEQEFHGEIFYKTPRWVILKEPMPDMSAMYRIDRPDIQCPQLKLNPYDYQKYGIRWMIDKLDKHNFVMNCDDVGTGKTIQTIGTLLWYIQNRGLKKVIVICKKSAKKQWSDEFDKFTDLRAQGFNILWTQSTASKRKKAYKEFYASDKGIMITNYHSFLNDSDLIRQTGPEMIVIDEAHVVKARTGKLNNNIMSVCQGLPVIFLTGTPIMSRPEDIFGIVQISQPDYFGTWKEYSNKYLVMATTTFGRECIGARNLDELRASIQDVLIQRTEYEISLELPKTVIVKTSCDMDSTQEAIINAINDEQSEIIDTIKSLEIRYKNQTISASQYNEEVNRCDARSKGLIAARQAAVTDPRMFFMSNSKSMREKYSPLIPASYKMSSKMENMIDLVETIIEGGNKVIIFSKFRTSAVLAAQDIQRVLKYPVLMYTGTENDDMRNNAIDLFCKTNSHNILIGTDAMAESLNLQVAHYEIMIDQPDTWAIKKQRIGRARRAGSQFDHVTVYDLITANGVNAKSKDEERLEKIEKDKNLTGALIELDESQKQAMIAEMKKEA